jgi:cyclase
MKKSLNTMPFAVALALVVTTAAVWGQGQDFSKVEVKATKVGGNVYALEGSGGTIAVLAGPDGVFMVDSQFAPLTEKIVAAIKQISPSPIKFLVNTHLHGDHTGGNANFGQLGVTLLGREQLRARLAKPAPSATGAPGTPAPAAALPLITYDAPVTLHMNGEQVQLIPIPRAHTDGDTLIKFVTADVIFTGDFYRALGYPNIDRANGGTLKGMIEGLNKIVELAGPATKIVPGHGAIVDRNAVTAHREMAEAISDEILLMVQEGMTVEEVLAKKVTAKFDSKVPGAGTTGERFVGQVYGELKGTPPR